MATISWARFVRALAPESRPSEVLGLLKAIQPTVEATWTGSYIGPPVPDAPYAHGSGDSSYIIGLAQPPLGENGIVFLATAESLLGPIPADTWKSSPACWFWVNTGASFASNTALKRLLFLTPAELATVIGARDAADEEPLNYAPVSAQRAVWTSTGVLDGGNLVAGAGEGPYLNDASVGIGPLYCPRGMIPVVVAETLRNHIRATFRWIEEPFTAPT